MRLRDCIIKIPDLLKYAKELGHSVVAITDHESMSGWMKIEQEAINYPDLKIIRGNEIYLCRNGLNGQNFVNGQDKYYHFILLAKDLIGAHQIMEISTRAWKRSYMGRGMRRVPTYYQDLIDIIQANPGHVIGSSACLGGALPTQLLKVKELLKEDKEKANKLQNKIYLWIRQMINIFGRDNFYFELQPSETPEQTYVNRKLVDLSKELNIPYIITCDSHYLKKEDAPIHKAFLNSQNGDREVDAFYKTTYLMGTEELVSKLSNLTTEEIQAGFDTIKKIEQQCQDFSLKRPLKIPQLPWRAVKSHRKDCVSWYERIPSLKLFNESDYIGDQILVDNIVEKLLTKPEEFQNQQTYEAIEDNLQKTWESSVVNKTHWSAYFLNLQKIIDSCWDAGTLVGPGRGSGVGFILLYLLDITQINPLRETVQTYSFRFLNPSRVSVLDVDVDVESNRRAEILQHFRDVYGEDRVANVATFRTEKSKSAILTACRGLGIDVDIAQYIASLIPADRGQIRSLSQCMYGDEENDFKPIKQFVNEMTNNYPEVWQVASNIEGLINGSGLHAGGVVFVDEPFTNSTGLMRAPDGTICTALELHDIEEASLIKMDLLSVNALDKIHNCLDLLQESGRIKKYPTLKETYEHTIGVYNLERNDKKMWDMVNRHEIFSLFQMEKQSGITGIELTHPESLADLAHLNSIIRLMAQEKGGEQPLNKFARFKQDINLWYKEMDHYGLTKAEQKILEPYLLESYGICESQEAFMMLVQIPECGGFDLNFADKLRKSIAKKNPKAFDELTKQYFEETEKKGLSKNLCNYVWRVLVMTSRGYGFNLSHTLAYSIVALQEMNLAYRFPIVYWNCANLISDSGGAQSFEDQEEIFEFDSNNDDNNIDNCYTEEFEEFNLEDDDNEDDDDDDEEELEKTVDKKKKKQKTTDYGRIATAIGKMRMAGIEVAPPNINKSTFTFSVDQNEKTILYGMSGISGVGEDIVKEILAQRPYTGWQDFIAKVKVKKPQMINLIKCGAFDEIEPNRVKLMKEYIASISDTKQRITLQNMAMLINFGLIPEEFDFVKRVYNFNKYLKRQKKVQQFQLDNIAFAFYEKNFDLDLLTPADSESGFAIDSLKWDKIYQKYMDQIRPWIKQNSTKLLEQVNERLMSDMWNKYCLGSLSKWEMDSISCYQHQHELANVDFSNYNISNFYDLNENPTIDRVLQIKGKEIPIFKIYRIAGTVLDRDKQKKTITLLTTEGVVTVKIFGEVFSYYDKQISEKGADGHKHIIRKSDFSRGNKLIITGIRRDESFHGKKYKSTPYHLVDLIQEVKEDGTLVINNRREEEAV